MGHHVERIECPECGEEADFATATVGRKLLERFINCEGCGCYRQVEGPYFEPYVDDAAYDAAPDAEPPINTPLEELWSRAIGGDVSAKAAMERLLRDAGAYMKIIHRPSCQSE
jgi:hypothetical protein